MAWQKRNMFSSAVDMQRGGSVPWPSYEGGGIIGATPKERKRMFTIWDKMTQGQKEKVMDGKRYQMGGAVMPTQLFEEGDQDINMALNNMASMTNPSLEQIGETEAVSIGPSMEGEMAMDQGPSVEGVKDKYQSIAKQYAMNLAEEGGDMNLFMKQAKQIEVAYANELEKMGEEATPENQLMTPEFVEEIQMIFTGDVLEMQTGGPVTAMTEDEARQQIEALGYGNRFTPAMWMSLSEEDREKWKRLAPAINTISGVDENKAVMSRLDDLLRQREKLAPQMAYAKPTKQGGILGFATQYNETKALEAAAKDKALEDAMNAIRYGARGTTGKSGTIPAAVISDLYGIDDDMKQFNSYMDRASKGSQGNFNVYEEIPGYINMIGRLPKRMEEGMGIGGTKTINNMPMDFYAFYQREAPALRQEWAELEQGETLMGVQKTFDGQPLSEAALWQDLVNTWKEL
jgi:hypothetical protein